jgi:uncharacterized membrane protein YgdD (TMEM256/DUF423 family)
MAARRANVPVALLTGAIALTAAAHHGDAGRYEETITTISGTVVALQLINPHSLLIFDVVDEATGQTVRWQAEISNANGLARIGWTRDTCSRAARLTSI